MTDSLLFKLDGHEVVRVNNIYDWAEWMDWGNLTVDYTHAGGIGVSTAFLGLAAPRATGGPPLLFETCYLHGADFPAEVKERYATWDEAEKGHEKWTRRAANATTTPKQQNA